MNRFVVGFMLSDTHDAVVLIQKRDDDHVPASVRGLWNGLGGRIEHNETPFQAMRREFREEAGVDCETWTPYAVLHDKERRDFEMYCFVAVVPLEVVHQARTMTDERVRVFGCFALPPAQQQVANMRWLLEMARSLPRDACQCFDISEVHDDKDASALFECVVREKRVIAHPAKVRKPVARETMILEYVQQELDKSRGVYFFWADGTAMSMWGVNDSSPSHKEREIARVTEIVRVDYGQDELDKGALVWWEDATQHFVTYCSRWGVPGTFVPSAQIVSISKRIDIACRADGRIVMRFNSEWSEHVGEWQLLEVSEVEKIPDAFAYLSG